MTDQINLNHQNIAADLVDGVYQLRVSSSPGAGSPGSSSSSPMAVTLAPVTALYARPNVPMVIGTGAYANGDVVGGLLTTGSIAHAYGGGWLQNIQLYDKADIKAALTLYVFNAAPTAINDNDPFALSDADLDKLIYKVDTGSYIDMPSNAAWLSDNLNRAISAAQLWFYWVTNASTPTWGATDALSMYLQIAR